MKKAVIILLFFILSASELIAMTQNQMMIINQVLNVDQGKITKQMHADFWNDVPDKDDIIGFMETSGLMAKLTKDGMNYQKELWKTALISYQTKQVFKSDDYLKAKDIVLDFINRVSKKIPNQEEREQVIMQLKVSMQNSDELIRSAASRTNFQSLQGPVIEISEDRIRFIISNIENSFERIDKLLNPNWEN
jgi:hypothetical protein